MMTDSINWVVSNAGKGSYANVDAKKIMVAGFSCGGVEAYQQIWDSRVATVGIFSSGLLDNQTAATQYRKPILYALGGSGDIAYQNVSGIIPMQDIEDDHLNVLILSDRERETSRTSHKVPLRGRVTSMSVMEALCSTQMVESLARLA